MNYFYSRRVRNGNLDTCQRMHRLVFARIMLIMATTVATGRRETLINEWLLRESATPLSEPDPSVAWPGFPSAEADNFISGVSITVTGVVKVGGPPWALRWRALQARWMSARGWWGRRDLLRALAGHDVAVAHPGAADSELEHPVEDQPAASRAAAIETKHELVQVALQMCLVDRALMGAQKPPPGPVRRRGVPRAAVPRSVCRAEFLRCTERLACLEWRVEPYHAPATPARKRPNQQTVPREREPCTIRDRVNDEFRSACIDRVESRHCQRQR